MLEIKTFLQGLEKFYWSPAHPTTYTMMLNNKPAGLGLIAMRDPAAFNFAWASTAHNTDALVWHTEAVVAFSKAESITKTVVEGAELGSYMTLNNLPKFRDWYSKNRANLPLNCRILDNLPCVVPELRRL